MEVKHSGYIGRGDWLHDVSFLHDRSITDFSQVPEQLRGMVSDVGLGSVSFYDGVPVNGLEVYGVAVRRKVGPHHRAVGSRFRGWAVLRMSIDLRFRLVDFKVLFSGRKEIYGYSNWFSPELSPKDVIDAFWGGIDGDDILRKLDVLLHGFLDNNKPITDSRAKP